MSAAYGNDSNIGRLISEIRTLNLTWEEYLNEIKNDLNHDYKRRIQVIQISTELFFQYKHFHQMPLQARKFIAGIPPASHENEYPEIIWAYFGSMKGAGYFKQAIINNNENISIALDQIPLSGQVTKQYYLNFWDYYAKPPLSDTSLGTATRLLCMKRPDIFICFNSKNEANLCDDFGIPYLNKNKDRYWTKIIERIFDSNWWNNTKPNVEDEDEIIISNARAAFLDSIFYER